VIYDKLLLATNWTVQGSNPSGGEIFRICRDRPCGPPSPTYTIGTGSFTGAKAAGAWRWPPTSFSSEAEGRVDLYLYSPTGPSWPLFISLYLTLFYFYFTLLHVTSLHFTPLHFTPPHLTSPHLTSLHVTSLHFTSPHLTSLHFTLLHFTRFTSLHFASLRFTSLHFTSLHFTSLHFTSLRFTSFHFTSLHLTSPHFTLLHFTSLRFASLYFASFHFTSPHLTSRYFTSLHSNPLHSTSPHLTSPHLTSPHLTSLHFTSLHFTTNCCLVSEILIPGNIFQGKFASYEALSTVYWKFRSSFTENTAGLLYRYLHNGNVCCRLWEYYETHTRAYELYRSALTAIVGLQSVIVTEDCISLPRAVQR